MKNSCRILGYDLIRIVAIFMVVTIHSNVIYLTNNFGRLEWIIMMEITAICLVSVPLFFMLSGALLLNANHVVGVNELFTKRLSKQFIPFILWSLIYVFLRILMGKLPLSINSITKLLYEPAYYQFWFMYTLLAIYLLLPILQVIVQNSNQKQIEYLLGIWLVFSVLIPNISYFYKEFRISEHIDLILCEGYIGYFLLGFYLSKYKRDIPNKIGLFLTVLGISIIEIGAYLEWKYCIDLQIKYTGYMYQEYRSLGVIIAVTGIFLICQKININHSSIFNKIIIKTSELSIGVFYVHMFILIAIERIGFSGENSMFIVIFKTILVYIISLFLSYIISKIPILGSVLLIRKN